VDKPDLSKYRPRCILAHEMINKLTIIVGHCDLLKESTPEDSHCLERLRAIGEVAKSMADELNRHQCHLDTMFRTTLSHAPSELN
jgi:hypothetical protein